MPYLFDGNNLIGQSADQARREPALRWAFLEQLSRWARAGGGQFLVFFDGDDTDRRLPPPGVRVRYSAPVSSDEAIVRSVTAARFPSEVIVVTNDTELSLRCRNAGAEVIDWHKFAAGMQKRGRAGGRRPAQESAVDVRDWAKYFGLDPDKLK